MNFEEMNEPGYEKLAEVLHRAYDQAARGKGKERHSRGEPFHEQVIADGARRFGVGSLLFQAYKKSEESQRLDTDRGVRELLGAIVYLSAAVIERERLANEAEACPDAGGFAEMMDFSGEVREMEINGVKFTVPKDTAEALIKSIYPLHTIDPIPAIDKVDPRPNTDMAFRKSL